MTRPLVVLDACVLVPIRLATTLLWLAEAEFFQPVWSDEILDEVERNLPKVGVPEDRAAARVGMMRDAFGAEALIDGFDDLIDTMPCDPKDRHVLAAAVRGEASRIVTFNLRDFPEASASRLGVEVVHPEEFLATLLVEDADVVLATLSREAEALRRPPESVLTFLASLTPTVPTFANLVADSARARPGSVSDVPALVAAPADQAAAAFGAPGDLTNPAQVAVLWWSAVLGDLDLVRNLTYSPPAWKGFSWVEEHLAGRSLASRVIPAVDAPDDVAFMRLVPEVASTSQVFEAYRASMTILTLVRVGDGTWRVWGLGPRMPSAREILDPD